jgi:hypothetical protein
MKLELEKGLLQQTPLKPKGSLWNILICFNKLEKWIHPVNKFLDIHELHKLNPKNAKDIAWW